MATGAGLNSTTLSQNEDITDLQTHNELSVYYEGPANQGAEIYLKFDKPVKQSTSSCNPFWPVMENGDSQRLR